MPEKLDRRSASASSRSPPSQRNRVAASTAARPTAAGKLDISAGEAVGLAGRYVELAGGGDASRVIELDEGRHDRFCALQWKRHVPPVGKRAKHRAVTRQ